MSYQLHVFTYTIRHLLSLNKSVVFAVRNAAPRSLLNQLHLRKELSGLDNCSSKQLEMYVSFMETPEVLRH